MSNKLQSGKQTTNVPERTARDASRVQRIGLGFLLAVATFAAYARVLTHDFIYLDDRVYVTENAMVQKGLTGEGIRWAFTNVEASNWHPLTWLSHMLDCLLFGLDAGGHHFTSLLLHIINVVLLFHLLWRLTGLIWPCAFVAGAFGLHPAHVESVAWVAERKDVLSTCLGLITLIAYVRFVEVRRASRYFILVAFFALALLAKPMMVTLPALMLLFDYWPLRRTQRWTRLIAEKGPLLLLSAVSSAVTVYAQKAGGALVTEKMLAFDDRVANALVSYAKYIGTTLWPTGLAVYYPLPLSPHLAWLVVAASLVLMGISVVVVMLRSKRPALLVGWLWFLGMLVPVIGLVQVGGQAMADRYTYIPIVGLFIMVAFGSREFPLARPHPPLPAAALRPRPTVIATATIILTFLAIGTAVQAGYWRDSITLFRRAIDVVPNNTQGHIFMANALRRAGQLPDAVPHFAEAVRIVPNEPYNRTDYGHALLDVGRPEEAAIQFEQALTLLPGFADAHYFLGMARLQQGRHADAAKNFDTALARNPRLTKAHLHLGTAYAAMGQPAPAISHFQKWLAIDPQSIEGLTALAQSYHSLGNEAAAREALRKAAQFHPQNPHPFALLAQLAAWSGEIESAISLYEKALQIDGRYAEAANNLAEILAIHPDAKIRNGARAVHLAEIAANSRGMKDPSSLDTLAAAYAEAGRFDDARRTIARAIELGRAVGSQPFLDHLEARQALYAANQPARAD